MGKFPGLLRILLFGLLFCVNQNLYSQETGYKYFKNYSYKEDYDHQAQNWGMVQAENGIIYVANNGGVLEFDGASWRIIGIPGYASVRSLAIDEKGIIYIGGKNEIGYLTPGKNGSLQYKSLLKHLDDDHKNFSNVWQTHATKNGVYFRSSKFLFRWAAGKIKVWKTNRLFKASFVCSGIFFVQQQEKGLMKEVNDSLKLIPDGETFAEGKILLMVPYDSIENPDTLLIGTYPKGFFLYDGKRSEPFPTRLDEYLRKNKLYQGTRLLSGDFALATLNGGLVIMDRHGNRKHILDKTSGLQDERVHYVFEDTRGNLWLALDKGISRVEYKSPFFLYDDRFGLSGTVLSVTRQNRDLYVGTVNGLYHLDPSLKFRPVPGINYSCWSLTSIEGEDSILAATSVGVFQVQNKTGRHVVNNPSYVLLTSKHYPGRTWCGTGKGLIALYQEKDKWMEEHRFKSIAQDIRCIAEDKNGNLWLVTSTGGLLKVDFPEDIFHPEITWYETSHGLPKGRVYITTAAGHVMFATDKGIFQFDEKKNKFIPDRTIGDEFAGGSKPVFRIVEDKNKNIWFHSQSRNYQAAPGPGQSYTIIATPFRRIPLIQVNAIYPDPDGKTAWFASVDGLIRYDTTIKKNYRQQFNVLIRKVIVNGNLIFNGCSINTDTESQHALTAIKFKDRKNFHFEYACAFFEAESETRYRYLLEGHDDHWSDWSSKTDKNFTTLDSGQYGFRVQAKNVYGQLGDEAIFRFKVLPPWYQTWWAFLLYGIGFFSMMFLAVKWRSDKLEKEKQKLERIIKERTKEVHEKNRQLENQTIQLKDQSEKLKEMDKVKSRFFANISHEFRTPLTLIMGPLEQMYADTGDNKQKDTYKVMLRNSQRLLTLINQLLDLSRFESGKTKLQAVYQNIVPFLKGTLASFQLLARQNQLELEFQSEEENISLYFDPGKMEEVMYNLLINAFKFTSANGKITVSVSIDRRDSTKPEDSITGFVNISVSDTGAGIPKEQLNYIFDRFYQAESLKEKGNKGTGLGLALTKEIVLLHHGKIDVHSQEGEGTEFVIRLPLGRGHLKPGEIATLPEKTTSDREKKKEMEALIGPGEDTDVEKEGVSENITGKQEKSVILVVEDNADVRKYICDPLKQDYSVIEAADGKEGMEKAMEIIPDLIVSDIMMPEVDGNELCRQVKKDIRTSHVPLILLTAKASEESVIQGLETGADDYITKPFNTKILMTRIKNLIELRSHLQQKIQKQMLLQPNEISVSSMDREFIKELQGIIEKNLSDPEFHVEQLSEKLYMNRATLYRKIKALTGETPTEFIRSYRLKRAAQLLKNKFGNVSEVALEVGFNNMAYFAERFKEKFHQLPSTYQASESGKQ